MCIYKAPLVYQSSPVVDFIWKWCEIFSPSRNLLLRPEFRTVCCCFLENSENLTACWNVKYWWIHSSSSLFSPKSSWPLRTCDYILSSLYLVFKIILQLQPAVRLNQLLCILAAPFHEMSCLTVTSMFESYEPFFTAIDILHQLVSRRKKIFKHPYIELWSSVLFCLLYSKHVSQHLDAQILRGSDRHFLPHIRTHIGKKHLI